MIRRLGLAVSLVLVMNFGLAPNPSNAAVGGCTAISQVEPAVAEFMLSQGVGGTGVASYAILTRGKETLVKLFLTTQTACTIKTTDYVKITNASLTISSGQNANPLFNSFANTPALPPAIQPESLGDPIFVVPAGNLTPAPLDATFTPTFSVTITFNRKLGTTTQSAQTKTISISPGRTFERETNALRVYLVPMGDVSQPYNTQYTSTDQTIVQNAMQTFSRIYPVPAGIADLTATTGGVRYVVDTATILDLRSISGAYTTALGATRFCGTTLNFNAIKGLLAQYLLAHNTANPNATADRVVGVVGGNTTTGRISFGTEDSIGCADGMASASSAESWVRLTPDPSRTGALMAMEVTHTFGLERNPSYHSSAIEADAGTDRAYNVAGRNRILSDHTVMDYNNTGSSWGNDNTLFEASDFGSLLCQLKPTSAGTTACPTPGNIGTSTGVAAGEKYVIAGTSDGLPGSGHSKVIEPYYSVNVAETPSLNSSELRLIQLDRSVSPPRLLSNFGLLWSPATTLHDDVHPLSDTGPVRTFYAAAPGFTDQGAGEVRIVRVAHPMDEPRVEINSAAVNVFSSLKVDPPSITSFGVTTIPPSGGTTTLTRNQITPRIPPRPDIVILADTTGSMGPALQNVRDNVINIVSDVQGAQPDAQFAAASYKDAPPFCTDPYVFRIEQTLTGNASDLQYAITPNSDIPNSGWQTAPGQGCDAPEAQLNALYNLATSTAVGYRSGSSRVIAWFGDAPGHDPSNGHTEAQVISALTSGGPSAGTGTTIRASVGSDSQQANDLSIWSAISGNGRFVAFVSRATNLVPNDTNNAPDVFVKDLVTGAVDRVDLDVTGGQADLGAQEGPISISDDGRFVSFMSQSHLFPREIQPPWLMDLYVRDRQAGTTIWASQGSYGTLQNAGSVSWDMISGSGRFVAFETDASDLVADDTNGTGDIYVRDLVSNAVELVSLDSSGRQLGNRSEVPSISTDGRFVSFEESGLDGSNFRGIYVRDRQLGTTENISGASPGNLPNDSNGSAAISGDGRYVAYVSWATNIVPGDTNGKADVFVFDRQTTTTERVSVASDGTQANADSNTLIQLSSDGRFVAFTSEASNLVASDANTARDVFVRDRQSSKTSIVSVASDGTHGNAASEAIVGISADGQHLGFASGSSNLVSGDTNAVTDIFVRQLDVAAADPSAGAIRIVAVNMHSGDGSLDATGQATRIANATGGVVESNTDASQVAAAILAGLHDLPATVTPVVDPSNCSPLLSASGALTFDPTSRTVTSGSAASFTEHVTVPSGTTPGTYTCQIIFKINGKVVNSGESPDPRFLQDISIKVDSSPQQQVTTTATSSDPSRLLVDLIYKCNSFNYVAAVAVAPSNFTATQATFKTNADMSNACASFGGGGTLVPYVSDGWNRIGGTVQTDKSSTPKVPTAAIYTPAVGTSIAWNGTLPLRGSCEVAGLEAPACTLTWSLRAPGGAVSPAGTGNALDARAPMPNGWTQGQWTAVLDVSYEGRTAQATRTFGAYYQFIGFLSPVDNPPAINTGTAGKTFAMKWQLKSGSAAINSLATVAATQYASAPQCMASQTLTFANTSGQSVLRFDQTNTQFVFNWQPPAQKGLYIFRLTLTDGSTHEACVQLS